MNLKNIKISSLLNFNLMIIMILVFVLGAVVFYNSNRLWESTRNIHDHPLTVQTAIGEMKIDISNIRIIMRDLILEKNNKLLEESIIEIGKLENDAYSQLDILYNSYLGPKKDLDNVKLSISDYKNSVDKGIELIKAGKIEEVTQSILPSGGTRFQADKVIANLKIVSAFAKNKADSFYHDAENLRTQIIIQTSIALLIILILTFFFISLLKKAILKPLTELTEATSDFQDGKLGTRSHYESKNEFGMLAHAFNFMAETVEEESEKKDKREVELIHVKNNLEAANKELEAFSYSVSHDLKAPIRHITGYASLLIKKYLDILPEEGRNYLENISFSAQNMGELIDGLLQFSKTGRVEMNLEQIDMNEIVDKLIQPIIEQDMEHRIQFNISNMPKAIGDIEMFKSVWSNFIENAVKFSKNISSAEITIGAEEKGDKIIYFISDKGAGFDMNYSSKLFTVFQRLHSREDYEGTGIGLATVRRIISRHGGETWAEGKVGEGATFYFSLLKRKESE
ncbi:MAG: ATP-binding protein [Eubacteriales bacterium]